MTSPIVELAKQGQSLWLDNIRRQLITSGELARMRDEGVTGVTSNPTIFEKAVSSSNDYDEGLVRLVGANRPAEDILWDLMIEDIQAAADVFRPVYERTEGADGYVSIEVSPAVARSTSRTIAMARDLRKRCDRPNVMVKIPATKEGLPAIRAMIGEGANINVTLIFSVQRYAEVVDSFMSGLEDLKAKGGDPSRVASVASFFVSRVDTKVDKILDAGIADRRKAADEEEARSLERLLGKAAIANSKMAYRRFQELHSGPRWEALEAAGARVQRCLWASTSTKDPRFPDTIYVEELIGPQTVNTVPPQTLVAFGDHGEVRRSLDENVEVAERQLEDLARVGVDLDRVTLELEEEGVATFEKSFEDLLKALRDQAKAIQEGRGPRLWYTLGELQVPVNKEIARVQKEEVARRLWERDVTLWNGPAKDIGERLGWLDVARRMLEEKARFAEIAEAAREYKDVVLMGMGGSSLAPDVLRNTFGSARSQPRLHVLDTTDPTSILELRGQLDLTHTLFLAASKSGETLETLSHFAYFWSEVSSADISDPGRHFAAITDGGSPLEALARDHGFRWIFANPADIGGRYSALSYFGLVPAAMIGIDVSDLLKRANEMAAASGAGVSVEKNPSLWLGTVMGRLAAEGRNKLTLIMSPKVGALGYWIEQLIAESTGKLGKGIVPVEGEPLGAPRSYGDDRLFVYTRMGGDREHPEVSALSKAGHPVITLTLRDRFDLGGEFLRWEIATAVAGSILGINAFDQPNVQESKDNTRRVLEELESTGRLDMPAALAAAAAGRAVADLMGQARAGAYFSTMSYTARDTASEKALGRIRAAVRDRYAVATTAGYGPRFLHSTGQLHKGGPPVGVFLQIVQHGAVQVAIPGQPYGFKELQAAQALGDLQSLEARKLPVARVDLGDSPASSWKTLADSVEKALR